MKKVPCSYDGCKHRRIHHERPDEERGVLLYEVPDDYMGPYYCSYTCALMAGAISLKYEPKDKP